MFILFLALKKCGCIWTTTLFLFCTMISPTNEKQDQIYQYEHSFGCFSFFGRKSTHFVELSRPKGGWFKMKKFFQCAKDQAIWIYSGIACAVLILFLKQNLKQQYPSGCLFIWRNDELYIFVSFVGSIIKILRVIGLAFTNSIFCIP